MREYTSSLKNCRLSYTYKLNPLNYDIQMMKLTVIIPTYNAACNLQPLLESVAAQMLVDLEIIVIDSSSTDGTLEIAKSFNAKTITIPKEEFGHGSTRNLAAKEATGDVIVFLTQDIELVANDSIEKLVEPFKDSNISATYGRQLPHDNASIFASHLRKFNYPNKSYVRELKDRELFGIKTAFLSNSFAAYRKRDLEAIGYFNQNLIFGEDTCAAAKMLLNNKKIAYVANACVKHSHNYSISQDFKRYFDMGVFHKREDWLLNKFGKPTGEGIRYIKSEIKYILAQNKSYLIPEFILRSCFKFLGYKLGLMHKLLPNSLCKKMSMNSTWWFRAKE